jgi:hypothetical protein
MFQPSSMPDDLGREYVSPSKPRYSLPKGRWGKEAILLYICGAIAIAIILVGLFGR